jgi:hypothetical protein
MVSAKEYLKARKNEILQKVWQWIKIDN